jgi:hypothetical protein
MTIGNTERDGPTGLTGPKSRPINGSVSGVAITFVSGSLYNAMTTVTAGTYIVLTGFTTESVGNYTLIDMYVSGTAPNWTLTASLNSITTPGIETFTFYYAYI